MGPYAYPNPMTDRDLGVQSNKKVDVYLEFKNDKQFGLGVPLPAGRIRVSQLDAADTSLEFIGEDSIDHTPKDETVRVKLGSAFDVVGERRQVDFAVDTKAQLARRGIRDQGAQSQGTAGGSDREGEPLPLEQLEGPHQDARLHEGGRAHHPLPGEGREGWRDRREVQTVRLHRGYGLPSSLKWHGSTC